MTQRTNVADKLRDLREEEKQFINRNDDDRPIQSAKGAMGLQQSEYEEAKPVKVPKRPHAAQS